MSKLRVDIINLGIAVIGLIASLIQIGYFVIDIISVKSYNPRTSDVPFLVLLLAAFSIFYGWFVFAYYRASHTVRGLDRVSRRQTLRQHYKDRAIGKVSSSAVQFSGFIIYPVILVWSFGLIANSVGFTRLIEGLIVALAASGFATIVLGFLTKMFVSSLLMLVFTDSNIYWESL